MEMLKALERELGSAMNVSQLLSASNRKHEANITPKSEMNVVEEPFFLGNDMGMSQSKSASRKCSKMGNKQLKFNSFSFKIIFVFPFF